MGLNEKTPLRGSEEHVPYVFMTDPNRAYKKKVRQLQCYLCSGIIAVFALALLVSVAYSVDMENEDEVPTNGSLSLSLKSSPNSDVSEFMESANDYIVSGGSESKKRQANLLSDGVSALFMDSTHLGKAGGKPAVSKKATNFIVNIANATATIGEDVIFESYYQTFPIEMSLDNVADTSAYTPSADVTFSATYDDDMLEGTVTIPLKDNGTFQKKTKNIVELNFVAGITIKWSGTFDFIPKKNYKCKLMFQSYEKLSAAGSIETFKKASLNDIELNDENEQCNIFLVGTYYKRPFYCPLTPWWCSEGVIYYWSGETKLIFTKPLPPAVPETLKNMAPTSNLLLAGSSPAKSAFGPGLFPVSVNVVKSFTSVKVISGQISLQNSGVFSTSTISISPPVSINVTSLQNPSTKGKGMQIVFKANTIGDTMINGVFTISTYQNMSGIISIVPLKGTFSFNVVTTGKGTINTNSVDGPAFSLDGTPIDPSKEYTCSLTFKGSKKVSPINEESALSSELCTLKVSGSFAGSGTFLWSGDMELSMSSKDIDNPYIPFLNSNQLQTGSAPAKSAFGPGLFPVSVNVVKSFTSVKVISGQISLQNSGVFSTSTISISPPVSINVTSLQNPSTKGKGMQIVFKANTIGDTMINGVFTIPTYQNMSGIISIVPLKGTFSFNVNTTGKGTINTNSVDGPAFSLDGTPIDPSKEYTCSLTFKGSKKISPINEESTISSELCTLKVSGSFAGSGAFLWSGDMELTVSSKDIDNPYIPLLNSNQLQTGSAPAKSAFGPGLFPVSVNVVKSFTSVKVISGQISLQNSGVFSTSTISISPPVSINVTSLQNPSTKGKGMQIVFKANTIGDTMINGVFTIPTYQNMSGIISIVPLKGTFSFNVNTTGKGTINTNSVDGPAFSLDGTPIDPSKEYTCSLTFKGSKKISPINEESTISSELCTLKVSGSFAGSGAFLWSGDMELTVSSKDIDNPYIPLLNSNQLQTGSAPAKSAFGPGLFPVSVNVVKSFTSVKVISGQISLQNSGVFSTSTISISPPVSINVTSLQNPSTKGKSMQIVFKANTIGDTMINGVFTIPTYQNMSGIISIVPLKGTFSFNVNTTGKGTINTNSVDGPAFSLDGTPIDPSKEYTCSLTFKGSKKISPINEESALSSELCTLKVSGSFAGSGAFLWSGDMELTVSSKDIDNPYIPLLNSNQLQTGSAPAKSAFGPGLFPVSVNVVKSFTSVKVISGQISLQNSGVFSTSTISISPPVSINITSLQNPSTKGKGMQIVFKANTIGDTMINGVFTISTYQNMNGIISIVPLKGTFSFNVVTTGKGTINTNSVDGPAFSLDGTPIDPSKEYTCSLTFKGSKKISPINEEAALSSELCTLKVSGSFAGTGTFLWSGDMELTMSSKDIDNPFIPFLSSNQLQTGSAPAKSAFGPGLFPVSVNVVKSFTSVKVISGQISLQNSGVFSASTISISPPVSINVTSLQNPSTKAKSMQIVFKANTIGDTMINGVFTIPTYQNMSGIISIVPLKGTFSFNVVTTGKGTINTNSVDGPAFSLDGTPIDPSKEYTCSLTFKGSKKISPINEEAALSSELCTLKLSGTFAGSDAFLWSGDMEFTVSSKDINNPFIPAINPKQFVLNMPSEQPLPSKLPNKLSKTEDFVITKTFASVTVLKGKVTGQFNGEEATTVLDGSPPIDFYLDNFINPNSFDVSLQATWQATPVDDNSITGTFSIPYFPTLGDTTDRRMFTANFTVDIIYKYGGSIGIIDPSKTYSCKVMFQGSKKLSAEDVSSNSDSRPVLTKTPFGESCSITISGSFYEPSIFCAITPWWCSKGKIFHWFGDIELAIKNKQNITEDGNNLKNSVLSLPKTFVLNAVNNMDTGDTSMQDYVNSGHRFGGRVLSGWIKTNNGGIFSGSTTVWSGELPFEIKFPIFWTPTNDDGSDLSSVYSHAILWSASIFHSTLQGSFSFPQYVGHGPPPNLKWISGTFSFQLQPDSKISLYNFIVPGMKYNSNLHYHIFKSSQNVLSKGDPATTSKGDPVQGDINYGIRAPIILLGKYARGGKSFIWNGTFIIDISKTAKDLTYG